VGCGAGGRAAAADQLAGGGGGQDGRAARRPQRSGASSVALSQPWYRHPSSGTGGARMMKAAPAARTCSPGGRPDRRKIQGHHKLVLTIEAARAAGPMLAAALSARRTMINGSALCVALAVTERSRPCWPDCGQTDQNADSGRVVTVEKARQVACILSFRALHLAGVTTRSWCSRLRRPHHLVVLARLLRLSGEPDCPLCVPAAAEGTGARARPAVPELQEGPLKAAPPACSMPNEKGFLSSPGMRRSSRPGKAPGRDRLPLLSPGHAMAGRVVHVGSAAMVRASWVREITPVFRNTLRRW